MNEDDKALTKEVMMPLWTSKTGYLPSFIGWFKVLACCESLATETSCIAGKSSLCLKQTVSSSNRQ